MQETANSTTHAIYTEEELAALDPHLIPHHIAIIMDGNRRWALKHSQPVSKGHLRGAEQIDPILYAAHALGVRVLTVYAFSTENWARDRLEVLFLMHLFETYLRKKRKQLVQEGVRLRTIGNLSELPSSVKRELKKTMSATQQGKNIDLVLAINYGGRDEICRSIKKIAQAAEKGEVNVGTLTEEDISRFLDTGAWPDPELLIRTSGEKRMSNFLIWQASYSELVTTDVLWPDFSHKDLIKGVIEYQRRQRRFGV